MSSKMRLFILIALVAVCFAPAFCPQSWVNADDAPVNPPLFQPPALDSTGILPDSGNLGPQCVVPGGPTLWDILLLVQTSLVTL